MDEFSATMHRNQVAGAETLEELQKYLCLYLEQMHSIEPIPNPTAEQIRDIRYYAQCSIWQAKRIWREAGGRPDFAENLARQYADREQ